MSSECESRYCDLFTHTHTHIDSHTHTRTRTHTRVQRSADTHAHTDTQTLRRHTHGTDATLAHNKQTIAKGAAELFHYTPCIETIQSLKIDYASISFIFN